jgi:hypothetical protein
VPASQITRPGVQTSELLRKKNKSEWFIQNHQNDIEKKEHGKRVHTSCS